MAAVFGRGSARDTSAPIVGRILKIRPPVSIRLAKQSSWKSLTPAAARNLPLHVDDEVKCDRGGHVLLYVYGHYVEPNPCTTEYAIPYTSTRTSGDEHVKIGGEVGLDFVVRNNSESAVVGLSVQSAGEAKPFGPELDVLRGNSIPPGSTTTVSFGDLSADCQFRVKAVLRDGSTVERVADLCKVSVFYISR